MTAIKGELAELLDRSEAAIRASDGTAAVETLCDRLGEARQAADAKAWAAIVAGCRAHPVHGLLLEDPYTARAFQKPRGYAGDAVMLDYVYAGHPPEGTMATGEAVFRATACGPNGQSVVHRRDLLAQRIDEAAERFDRPRILSVACGHLRETQIAQAVRTQVIGEFVALDQDAESLAVVAAEQAEHGVRTIHASVTALIRGRPTFRDFHLVYAAGLFDYLSDRLAARLLEVMAEMLAPGGRLLVANFTPHNHGRAYMECFMDWELICRDESEMLTLAGNLKPDRIEPPSVYSDTHGNVVYLELAGT